MHILGHFRENSELFIKRIWKAFRNQFLQFEAYLKNILERFRP